MVGRIVHGGVPISRESAWVAEIQMTLVSVKELEQDR